MSTPPVTEIGRSLVVVGAMVVLIRSSTPWAKRRRRTARGSLQRFARVLRAKPAGPEFFRAPSPSRPGRLALLAQLSRGRPVPAGLAHHLNDFLSSWRCWSFHRRFEKRSSNSTGAPALLRRAIEGPQVASSGAARIDCAEMRALGLELCDRLREHLVFEADALRPVFAVLDYWGPERIRGAGHRARQATRGARCAEVQARLRR